MALLCLFIGAVENSLETGLKGPPCYSAPEGVFEVAAANIHLDFISANLFNVYYCKAQDSEYSLQNLESPLPNSESSLPNSESSERNPSSECGIALTKTYENWMNV